MYRMLLCLSMQNVTVSVCALLRRFFAVVRGVVVAYGAEYWRHNPNGVKCFRYGGVGMRFPRRIALANLPTPIERLNRLSERFGVEVYVKRDDMTGSAETGNKIRKLEYVLADALSKGCDVVVTCGAADSNHARATAIAARRLRLLPHLVLRKPRNGLVGNLLLDRLVGAELTLVEPDEYYADLDGIRERVLADLRKRGRKPYWVPTGASMPLGAVGYVGCASEIALFEARMGLRFDAVVFGTGSGGTAAGLLVGAAVYGLAARIIGINTGEPTERLRNETVRIANGCAELLEFDRRFDASDVVIVDGFDAGGYGEVNERTLRTLKWFAENEGLLLDLVYTAKAASGLLGLLERGEFKQGDRVLFIHTGGLPGLFSHCELLEQIVRRR